MTSLSASKLAAEILYNCSAFKTRPSAKLTTVKGALRSIPHAYDCITELCTQEVAAIQNHETETSRDIGQGGAELRKCSGKRINLQAVMHKQRNLNVIAKSK
jgi:hypothetical protein